MKSDPNHLISITCQSTVCQVYETANSHEAILSCTDCLLQVQQAHYFLTKICYWVELLMEGIFEVPFKTGKVSLVTGVLLAFAIALVALLQWASVSKISARRNNSNVRDIDSRRYVIYKDTLVQASFVRTIERELWGGIAVLPKQMLNCNGSHWQHSFAHYIRCYWDAFQNEYDGEQW